MKVFVHVMRACALAVLMFVTLGQPTAAEAKPQYCFLNRASADLYFRYINIRKKKIKGVSRWETKKLAPNKKICCVDCSANATVYFDRNPPNATVTGLRLLGMLALKLAKASTPTGAHIRSNDIKDVCDFSNLYDRDLVEIFETKKAMRCDVVGSDGFYRYSRGPTGNARAPVVSLRLCNRSSAKDAFAAVAYADGPDWRSRGWWKVPKSGCTTIDLGRGYRGDAFYYVTRGEQRFEGKSKLCHNPKSKFDVRGAAKKCPGGQMVGFLKTTLQEGQTMTIRLNP